MLPLFLCLKFASDLYQGSHLYVITETLMYGIQTARGSDRSIAHLLKLN